MSSSKRRQRANVRRSVATPERFMIPEYNFGSLTSVFSLPEVRLRDK